LPNGYSPAVNAGSNQRRQRFCKSKRTDFFERQFVGLHSGKQLRISVSTRLKRFDPQRVNSCLSEMMKQQRRDDSLPDSGIRARDKKDSSTRV
jgi:hypothetical protein